MTEEPIEPISEICGNIEVTFNTKNKELDDYDPIFEQLVMTLGKTGRANRLTFDNLDSESLYEAADALTEIADQIKEIEKELQPDPDEDFDVDMIESGVNNEQTNRLKTVKDAIDSFESEEDPTVLIQDIKNKVSDTMEEETVDKVIDRLKRDGELFEPNGGKEDELTKVQRI